MRASRNVTSMINFILDNLCPPLLRDCYPLMYPIYRLAYGEQTAQLLHYKDHYPFLTEQGYAEYYNVAAKTPLAARPTDLDRAGFRFILSHVEGTCLDAGCGRGSLAKRLSGAGYAVTGLDIEPPEGYSIADGYTFVTGSVECIPFSDNAFDTVVCAHVLEHVQDLDRALAELLRVAKGRLILVLPKQREYRYTADLHVRYFPYLYNVQRILPVQPVWIGRVGSDWGILIEGMAS